MHALSFEVMFFLWSGCYNRYIHDSKLELSFCVHDFAGMKCRGNVYRYSANNPGEARENGSDAVFLQLRIHCNHVGEVIVQSQPLE